MEDAAKYLVDIEVALGGLNEILSKEEIKIETGKLKRQFVLSPDTVKKIGLLKYNHMVELSMSDIVELAIEKLYKSYID